jgi:hypothetical protein
VHTPSRLSDTGSVRVSLGDCSALDPDMEIQIFIINEVSSVQRRKKSILRLLIVFEMVICRPMTMPRLSDFSIKTMIPSRAV